MKLVLKMVITLLALVGFALAARQVAGTTPVSVSGDGSLFVYEKGVRETVMGLGLALLGAWLMGKLAQMAKLSKITGYLIFGLAVGPNMMGVIHTEELDYLKLANDLAIALIGLAAGGAIEVRFVREAARTIRSMVGAQVLLVMALVTTAMYFVLPRAAELGVSADQALPIAMVVGVIATAGSPAIVIALVDELQARGRFTQVVLAATVCKDLLLVVLFAIVTAMAGTMLGVQHGSDEGSLIVHLMQRLIGSLGLGGVLGLALAAYAHVVGAHLGLTIVGAAFGTALLSNRFELEPLLVALAAGLLMRNAYRSQTEAVFGAIRQLTVPVYAVFFAVAGCKTDPRTVAAVWPAVAALVMLRIGAVSLGTWWGARIAHESPGIIRWGWTAFISQAGVSLAFANVVDREFGAMFGATDGRSSALFGVLVSAIAINELVGPVVFKLGLIKSGDAGREYQTAREAGSERSLGA